jgi:Zn-dependent peptidase ImmA (M78 family)
MKQQYLAHTIRAMEDHLRSLPGNEMFRIICSPVAEAEKSVGIASAHYYKNRYFAIYYHPETDEKLLRVMLAHELGHLFLVDMFNASLDTDYDENTRMEPMSTVFGVFTILDKNDFYYSKTAPFKHRSPGEVLDDFSLLLNRDAGKLNVSS